MKRPYVRLGKVHHLDKVLHNGYVVVLDDHTRWESANISETAVWLPTQRIVVEENNSAVYPYRLKNLDSGQEVEAHLQ